MNDVLNISTNNHEKNKVLKIGGNFIRYDETGLFQVDNDGLFYWINPSNVEKTLNTLKITCGNPTTKSNSKEVFIAPQKPLVINWLISCECTNKCRYCYAEDLMKTKEKNSDYKSTADNILKYNPLAVVLTGGEAFMNKDILQIVDYLHDKTKVIIDTNGYLVTDEHIKFLKDKNTLLRVSIDDERPKVNEKLRPLKHKSENTYSLYNAIETLNKCFQYNEPFNIHTVLTKKNMNDLTDMALKFSLAGVRVWRLFPLNTNHINDKKKEELIYQNIKRQESILKKVRKLAGDMNVLIDDEFQPSNSAILVSPNGNFYTELNGKKVPATDENINYTAHYQRYLRLENA